MGSNLTFQGMWVARARAIRFAERGVIGSQRPGDFLLASIFFLELEKNVLTAHSRITTTNSGHPHSPNQPRACLLKKLRIGVRRQIRTKRRSGWGILSQQRSERLIRRSGKEKSIRKRKEMVGFYYL